MVRVETCTGTKNHGNLCGTFSMVARCSKSSALGVCVSTAVPAVGSVVPHAEIGVGAIATQGYTNILYGTNGLKLLKAGFSPEKALETMLAKDPKKETRQVAIIDKLGRKAAFTGSETQEWRGHMIGEEYVAAGNTLRSERVLEAMAETFGNVQGSLAERLMCALEAAQQAGGDRRGRMSAALLVVDQKRMLETRPLLSLRVDLHTDPVKDLRRIFEAYKDWAGITPAQP